MGTGAVKRTLEPSVLHSNVRSPRRRRGSRGSGMASTGGRARWPSEARILTGCADLRYPMRPGVWKPETRAVGTSKKFSNFAVSSFLDQSSWIHGKR